MALPGLCLVTLFGFFLLSAIWGKTSLSPGERLALAYGVGLGLFTYMMFLILAADVRLSRMSILLFLVGLSILLGLAAWRRGAMPPVSPLHDGAARALRAIRIPCSRLVAIFVATSLLGLTLSALAIALYWPIWTWDALTMFEYRGRAIAVEQSLAFLKHEMYWGSFPLLTSLAHTLVHLLGGATPNVLYPPFYLSLAAIFYLNAVKLAGRWAAAAWTLIVATTPLLWQHGAEPLTNLPFTFYYAAGTIYVYRWMVGAQRSHLLLGGLLLGLSSWTRYGAEPLFLAVALPATVCAVLRRQYSAPALFLGMFVLLELPWLLYQRYILEVVPAHAFFGVGGTRWDFARLQLTLAYLGKFFWSVHTHGAVWLMFLAFLLLNVPRWRDASSWLACITLLGLGAWTASIYLTALAVEYLAPTSGERLLLCLLPLAALYCAVSPLARGKG